MQILFLNIWNFKQTAEVSDYLKKHVVDTDVFCFQEAEDKTKWFCKRLLPSWLLVSDYKFINADPTTYDDEFPQATYLKPALKLIEAKTLLADSHDTGLAIHTKIEHKGKIISICNMHGVSKPGNKLDTEARLKQSEFIIDFYKDATEPVIIGGDFNLEKETKSVKTFSDSGYRDLIAEFNISTTRNRLVWEKYPTTIQHYSDFVFVKNNVEVQSFIVEKNEVSDHLPMILTIG